MFTISELADAVGKSENFVRQHIYRGHLAARKDGRHTHVTTEEALRWSRERQLPFAPSTGLPASTASSKRATRLTVAAFRGADGCYLNAFTLARFRRLDALGPWAPKADRRWRCASLDHGFSLFTLDTDPDHGQELIEAALTSGTMTVDDIDCHYDLLSPPRAHWAYRNHHGDHDTPILSPFFAHSAEVLEHWCRDGETRRLLTDALDALPPSWDGFASLAFPLQERSDRLGNLVVASAWDPITCNLDSGHDGILTFEVSGDAMPGEYRATVWASHSGDNLLCREIPAEPGTRLITLPSSPDRIGYALFRSADGQCVDLMDADLIMDVHVRLDISTGPALNLTDRRGNTLHTVEPSRSRSRVIVAADDESAEVDRIIRTRKLGHHATARTATARRQGVLARFKPADFAGAVQHLVGLLEEDADRPAPVYLADRYFVSDVGGVKGVQLYADMLAATIGRELRVLCTQRPCNHPHPWWQNLPTHLTRHLKVRCFFTHGSHPAPAFHDRYLITPKRETLLSHSLNGWIRDGVTFVTLPYGVYRTEADLLWSMDVNSLNAPLLVEEYV